MEVLSEINWQLILMIALTSAVVSYIGDVLGMKLGKRRISLFGLRPKHTSTVITVLTGVAVAAVTLVVMALASGQVRHAFFGVNYLDRRISQLTVDVRDRQYQLEEMELEVMGAKNELAKLTEESNVLRKGLDEMKAGRVVAFGGELLSQTVIESGADESRVAAAMDSLIELAESYLRRTIRGGANDLPDTKVAISDAERAKVVAELASSQSRKVLRLYSPANVVMGQSVDGVVDTLDSSLIYRSGDLLMSRAAPAGLDTNEAGDALYTMLRQLNRSAVQAGVMPDPISGTVGNLETGEFYEIADRIADGAQEKDIKIYAARDIYSEGPVAVRVEVFPRGAGK